MPHLPILDFYSTHTFIVTSRVMFCYPDVSLSKNFYNLTIAKACADQGHSISNDISTELIFAPSFHELPDKITPTMQKGASAGDILFSLYRASFEGEQPSIYKAISEVQAGCDAFYQDNKARNNAWSEKVLKENWKSHKSVAPLWAAARTTEESFENIWKSFHLIQEFFFKAEFFANFGINTFLHNKKEQKRSPLFTEEEVWRIPQKLRAHLPRASLEFIFPK